MGEDEAISSLVKPLGGGNKLSRYDEEDEDSSIPHSGGKGSSFIDTAAKDHDESDDDEDEQLSSIRERMNVDRNDEEVQELASETHRSKDLTPHERLIKSLTNGVLDLDWIENHMLYSRDDGVFYDRISAWIDRLNEIHQAASDDESLRTTKIPMEALSYIDNDSSVGCNPEVFSRLMLDRCKQSFTKAKMWMSVLDKLRTELEQS